MHENGSQEFSIQKHTHNQNLAHQVGAQRQGAVFLHRLMSRRKQIQW